MRGCQRGGGSILVLLLGAIALGLVPAVPAHAQPGSPNPETSFSINLGPLWYIRSDSVYDSISMVEGGVEGSAGILLPGVATNQSDWFFIEGREMFFDWDPPNSPQTFGIQISEKGRTTKGFSNQVAIEPANRKVLSGYLLDVYVVTAGTAQESRHMPFLTGTGWASPGAKQADAEYILGQLDLTVTVVVDKGGSGSVMRVTSQEPSGGVLIPEPTNVTIHVIATDGKSVPLLFAGKSVGGDTPSDAPVVTISKDAPVALLLLDIGAASTDQLDVPDPASLEKNLSEKASDCFWKIKIDGAGGSRKVTFRSTLTYPPVALAAWTKGDDLNPKLLDNAAAVGYGAKIQFEVPTDGPCYIQAEFPTIEKKEGEEKIRVNRFGELPLEIVLE